jgi:hypothetical protein
MNPELVAYRGNCFAIEWYFDARGYSQPYEYFELLSEDRQNATLVLFKRMGDAGKIFDITKFRSEGDKIFAFKPQPDRFLCFFVSGRKLVVSGAFEKKSQKIPRGKKDAALKAKADYETRVRNGNYYA